MSSRLRLIIDIGNSNIVIGLNNNQEWIKIYRINTKSEINYWSFEKKLKKILKENNISPSEIYSVTVSSVVPSMTDIIKLVINDLLYKVTSEEFSNVFIITKWLSNPRSIALISNVLF